MEWIIIPIVLAAALICPTMMFGPMLLQRLGLRKKSSSGMSCMGMSTGNAEPSEGRKDLRHQRSDIDREIAAMEIVLKGSERRSLRQGSEPPAGRA